MQSYHEFKHGTIFKTHGITDNVLFLVYLHQFVPTPLHSHFLFWPSRSVNPPVLYSFISRDMLLSHPWASTIQRFSRMYQSNCTCGSHVNESNSTNLLYRFFVSGFKAETARIYRCAMYAYNSGIAPKILNNCIIKNKIITIDPTLFV